MTGRVVAALLAAILLAAAPASAADIGRVKRATGDAAVLRAGKKLPAKPGLVIQNADVLMTGPGGRIAVTFIDNSRFSAGPDSQVSLDTFTFNSTTHDGAFVSRVEKGSLAIISGQIAKKTPDAMKIRTPTSILGVRGTRFVVEVAP